mmetsp:Transcript_35380/g.75357  ORF Transcript_35380/g.75357 Transcript_35380/m.75357 type:complete len:307 (+) Transcript_35380:61-981(+)
MRTVTASDELPLCADSAMRESGRRRESSMGVAKILGAFMLFSLVCMGAPLLGRNGSSKRLSRPARVQANLNKLTGLEEADEEHAEVDASEDDEDAEPELHLHEGWPCEPTEELFFGKCYISCANVTSGNFTFRDNDCTCCKEHPCDYSDEERFRSDCPKHNADSKGEQAHPPFLTDCPFETEELFQGLCYKKCSLMTNDKYPIRTGMNTCSNSNFGGNWTMGFGPCSGFGIGGGQKCLPHIPKPMGAGHFASPQDQKGVAPMGFKTVPMPVHARDALNGAFAGGADGVAGTPMPVASAVNDVITNA